MLDLGTAPWNDDLSHPIQLGPSGPVDAMLSGIPAMIGLMFAAILVLFVFRLIQGAQRFAQNSTQPERDVTVRVVGRRTQTTGGGESPVTTTYHATFEMSDGERLELKVPHHEYGLLVEGDQGRLTHQGTWFRGFERVRGTPLEGPWEAPGGPTLLPPPPSH